MSAGDILRPWSSFLVVVKIVLSSRGDAFNKPQSISFHCAVIQQLKQFNWLLLLCFNCRIWKLQLSMHVTVNQIILKLRKYCKGGNALKPWSLLENPEFGGNCPVSSLASAFCCTFIDKFKTQTLVLLSHFYYFFFTKTTQAFLWATTRSLIQRS